jgi:hypothetical protein
MLPVKSCLIEGEAIVCDATAWQYFNLLRQRWHRLRSFPHLDN